MWQRPGHAQFEITDDRFMAVAFIMLPNNRFKWTAFTKERAGVSLLFCFFWGGGWGGTIFPGASVLKQ